MYAEQAANFNSTIVRLKEAAVDFVKDFIEKFQFYDSTIKSFFSIHFIFPIFFISILR